jgi:thiol-disulfide isomerase/thioredoxin
MFSRLRRRRLTPVSVRLFERPGCHLCEEVEEALGRLAARYPIELEKVDIRADPELMRRYDIVIPVVSINGAVELSAPIDGRELRRAIDTAARSPLPPAS